MDDVVSGAQNLDTASQLQCQLQNMLETCGMKLHKWNSNSKELLNSSSDQEHSFSTNAESWKMERWKPTGDYFMFKVSIPSIASCTKRDVLSVIARLCDPLGLIGPVISKAKIFLQKLWLRKLNWEEFLPDAIAPEWLNFVSSLKALEELKIDRYILTDSYVKVMLLGYADASESAYGTVVYTHSVKDGTTTAKLISSKSRVAPIKVISIPHLELSACLLLAQLVGKVRLSLQVHLAKVILHTDSTIEIAWINTSANQLKIFVGNRVSKIQTLTENFEWKHIPSAQNPADIISRGVNPEELSSLTLWWNGPQHLDILEQFIDPSITSSDELYMSELKEQSDINLTSILDSNFENDLLNITNNYMKLIGLFSYIFRFLYNFKNTSCHSVPLTNEELQKVKLHLIKRIQVTVFNKEIDILRNRGTIKKGAGRELQRLYNQIKNPPDILANYLTNEKITWKFIPPRSPNFGGLWEAGVKSFKHQFKGPVGDARLTLEQFITITTQIESILNSRPLTPMSSDPNDFAVLTPGHFLIGRPLQSLPEPDMTDKLDNRLSQWQKLTKFVQFIWSKWRLDYLNN
ncbi:uncharacterized protein TNCV_2677911 [Trichonephila clavipes]|nr:uncharacterized protein TNCV_2677911 [Trichonephila clavipes]